MGLTLLMVNSFFVSQDGEVVIVDDGVICDRDWELMQYTGLKDKNGVEIYEGDIVRILYTDWISQGGDSELTLGEYKDSISNIGKVVFQDCEFRIQFNVEGYTSTIHCGPHGQIKQIGNIYEHKHLIGEG